jgi:hypothetical protein
MGDLLRDRLRESAWRVVNDTPLPTVCFVDANDNENNSLQRLKAISDAVVDSGKAWISTTLMGGDTPVIRACVTNYATTDEDIGALVADLDAARTDVKS